jgi:signal transduction histidine kinase
VTPPEWVAASEEQMEKLARTGRIGPYEKQYVLKNGTKRWMLFAGRDLGDGTIAEYCIDVSDRRSAEDATRAIERRFRALVQATSDVVYHMTPDWSEMRLLQGHDFLADTADPDPGWLQKYVHPDDHVRVWQAIQESVQTQSIFQLEHRVLRADGEPGWTFTRAIPLRDERGEISEWFGAATDITARKRAEEALLKSEKLATLGRLAATIAHEINNPLEATTNLLYLIQTSDRLPESTRHLALAADAELKRVAHITRQSLGFYREASGPAPTCITELLDASIDLLRAKIMAKKAHIRRDWTGSYEVQAVSGELRQVFSNLLANALDALEPGGEVRIRVRQQRSPTSASDRSVRITFADDGKGIAQKVQATIFDPLFSTKGNLGTGLGLWVTKQIVTKHKGRITMRSRSGAGRTGTVFCVVLPEML